MKYIKPFFEAKEPDYSEIDKIIEDIRTISHILEDEGYIVHIERKNLKLDDDTNKFLPDIHSSNVYDINIVIDITHPEDDWKVWMDLFNKENDFYEEWDDRLSDICRANHTYKDILSSKNYVRITLPRIRRIKL